MYKKGAGSFIPLNAEVNINGQWQRVQIVDKESEYLYKIHFQGLNDSADEWVSVRQIRNIDSTSKPISFPEQIKLTDTKDCSFTPPVSAINNADKFSEKVGKRKIFELLTFNNKDNKKKGLTYLFFQQEQPYGNSISFTASHEMVLKNALAPAGAMIYPIRTKYKLCEKEGQNVSTKIIDGKFSCFRNNKGFWECVAD